MYIFEFDVYIPSCNRSLSDLYNILYLYNSFFSNIYFFAHFFGILENFTHSHIFSSLIPLIFLMNRIIILYIHLNIINYILNVVIDVELYKSHTPTPNPIFSTEKVQSQFEMCTIFI